MKNNLKCANAETHLVFNSQTSLNTASGFQIGPCMRHWQLGIFMQDDNPVSQCFKTASQCRQTSDGTMLSQLINCNNAERSQGDTVLSCSASSPAFFGGEFLLFFFFPCSQRLSCVVCRDAGLLLPLLPVPPQQDGEQQEQQEAQCSPDQACCQRKVAVPRVVHLARLVSFSGIVHSKQADLRYLVYVTQRATPLALPKHLSLLSSHRHDEGVDMRIWCAPLQDDVCSVP